MRVRKYGLFLAVLFAALVSTAQLGAQSVPVTLVKAGRLLDPRTGNVLALATRSDGNLRPCIPQKFPSKFEMHLFFEAWVTIYLEGESRDRD